MKPKNASIVNAVVLLLVSPPSHGTPRAGTSSSPKAYVIKEASGEAFKFSQIDTLEAADKSTFKAAGTIYTTGSGGTPDVHATPAAWKKAGEEVAEAGKFKALIRKDGERYILIGGIDVLLERGHFVAGDGPGPALCHRPRSLLDQSSFKSSAPAISSGFLPAVRRKRTRRVA